MFGIGLPELILIMALALIVVGPDKLPDLARSLAKGLMELKKTADSLKNSFVEQDNPLNEIRPELEEAAKSLKDNVLDPSLKGNADILNNILQPADRAAEAYQELLKHSSGPPPGVQENNRGTTDPPADGNQTIAQKQAETRSEQSEPKQSESR